jgi:hypothetical protein
LIGGFIGIVVGYLGFLLLKQFVRALKSGKKTAVFLGIAQPVLLFASLFLCALVIPGQLHWAGAGITLVLIAGTYISALRSQGYKRGVAHTIKPMTELGKKEAKS